MGLASHPARTRRYLPFPPQSKPPRNLAPCPAADAHRLLARLHRLRLRRPWSLHSKPHPSRDIPHHNHRHRRRHHPHHNRLLDSNQPRPPRPAVNHSAPGRAAQHLGCPFEFRNLQLRFLPPSCCHPRRGIRFFLCRCLFSFSTLAPLPSIPCFRLHDSTSPPPSSLSQTRARSNSPSPAQTSTPQ